jgi:hypothetical protein
MFSAGSVGQLAEALATSTVDKADAAGCPTACRRSLAMHTEIARDVWDRTIPGRHLQPQRPDGAAVERVAASAGLRLASGP